MKPVSSIFRIFLVLSLIAVARPAFADEAPPPAPQDRHLVSITFAPILLIDTTAEFLGEVRLLHKVSVAAILAYGRPSSIDYWEAGVQGRYYLLGGFEHGLNIGAQLMYVGGATSVGSITSVGNGLDLGAFLGYKKAFGFGLTFDIEAGVQWLAVTANGRDSATGVTTSAGGNRVVPLLRLNLGWSI